LAFFNSNFYFAGVVLFITVMSGTVKSAREKVQQGEMTSNIDSDGAVAVHVAGASKRRRIHA